jgi:hypothetical protein
MEVTDDLLEIIGVFELHTLLFRIVDMHSIGYSLPKRPLLSGCSKTKQSGRYCAKDESKA